MDEKYAQDSEIIELLFRRDERALELLSDKYSRLYTSVLRGALTSDNDVQECINDLLLSIWYSIPPSRPERLSAYIVKLARRIGINRFRYNTRQKRNEGCTVILSELGEVSKAIPDTDNAESDRELSKILSDFISSLDEVTRVLFVRRYVYLESVTSLAERFEMTDNAVSVRLHRARKKLKKLLEKEGLEL